MWQGGDAVIRECSNTVLPYRYTVVLYNSLTELQQYSIRIVRGERGWRAHGCFGRGRRKGAILCEVGR